jgi:DNA-binding NtrC family response regulator
MNARILVVDDEPDIRLLLKDILEDEGYLVDVAEHARAADEIKRATPPDLVLLDIWMPGMDGVTLLKQWKASPKNDCPVVMMSGHGTVETAVEATRFGAADFVEKPLSMAKLLSTVKSALSDSISGGQQDSRQKREEPVGNSRIVRRLKQRLLTLRDTSQAVFFTGANGSGRRIWAEFLCEGIGGLQNFDVDGNGRQFSPLTTNLYVEEIIDLRLDQQSRLYDAIMLLDSSSRYRFIFSSRYDYEALKNNAQVDSRMAEFWRNAILVPSLDDHVEDIPELLEYYVNWFSVHDQLPYRHFNVAAQNLLRNYHWSGDITQLKQFIKSVLSQSDQEKIELEEIEQTLQLLKVSLDTQKGNRMSISIDMDLDLREAREAFEREYLSRHLALSGNNMTELSRRVGQERTHLYRKLKALGLDNKKS